jgi:hypothetical protein
MSGCGHVSYFLRTEEKCKSGVFHVRIALKRDTYDED